MSAKTIKIIYWTQTMLFVLFMLMDGFDGVTRQQAGADVMNHLGYTVYAPSILESQKYWVLSPFCKQNLWL